MIHLIKYRPYITPRFSSNSEADASELLENLEVIFPRENMDGDVRAGSNL